MFAAPPKIEPGYKESRDTSAKQAITTPVPMNASFDNPARTRKADRNAPYIPDKSPKNPLIASPSGK